MQTSKKLRGIIHVNNEKKQHFNKPIMEVIKSRSSVRSYNTDKLSEETKIDLIKYANSIKGPFSPKVRLEFIDNYNILDKSNGKIGTYGIIKGAQHFIIAIVEDGEYNLEQLGYVLEKFILYAASLGLGTCWMGGTFKRSDFAKLVELKGGEIFPIVTPIGYPKDQRSIVENFMRYAAGSNQRKPWNELFYNESFSNPIEFKDVEKYADALEAVRLAPSASNKQPWKILKSGNVYNFYLKANKGYADGLGFNIQKIDMGIAMSHFEMILQEKGINGYWNVEDIQNKNVEAEGMTYCASWMEATE